FPFPRRLRYYGVDGSVRGSGRAWRGTATCVVTPIPGNIDDEVVAHRASVRGESSGPPTARHGSTTPTAAGGRVRTSFAESFAGADREADAQRRVALRRMKMVALSFLIGATGVFLACRWAQAYAGAGVWVGYVGAAAEAGMVGALADWFAV